MTTPNKSHKLFSPLFLVAFLCVLITHKSFAQFVVKENTILTLKQDVHTLEQNNSFQSDLLGEGTLHFIGVSQQVSTSSSTSLSNVAIHDASQLEIKNKLHINGDLKIISENLALHHPLLMQGSIRLFNTASIQNAHLISYLFTEQIEHNKGTLVQNIQIPAFLGVNANTLVRHTVESLLLKKAPLYVVVSYLFDTAPPLSPPPENTSFS